MLFSNFREENYQCSAAPQFVSKCVPKWQEQCRLTYSNSPADVRERLCEHELNRNYVKIRTLIPQEDIVDQWKWDRRRRDFDVGYFSTRLPHFTPTGFKRMRLPAELHSYMQRWLRANKNSSRPESSQPAFGFNCNTGYDNDDWVVPYRPITEEDGRQFAALSEWIRAALSQWTGQNVNERTAVYGARQYHRGSICGMHTDAMQTHAFSAIYQLDQQGMDQPWGLDYVTHGGEEGRAFMEPGDVMLYESASSIHGRKTPLRGDEFTNVFFHFRSPNWLPEVNKRLDAYWGVRRDYETTVSRPLTSLANAPRIKRRYGAADSCHALRNRTTPLMQLSGFTDTPAVEAFNASAALEAAQKGMVAAAATTSSSAASAVQPAVISGAQPALVAATHAPVVITTQAPAVGAPPMAMTAASVEEPTVAASKATEDVPMGEPMAATARARDGTPTRVHESRPLVMLWDRLSERLQLALSAMVLAAVGLVLYGRCCRGRSSGSRRSSDVDRTR